MEASVVEDRAKSGVGDRIVGGIGGFVSGGIIGLLVMIVVFTVAGVSLGWRNSFLVGALFGLVVGVVFPEMGKGLAYLMSLALPL